MKLTFFAHNNFEGYTQKKSSFSPLAAGCERTTIEQPIPFSDVFQMV